MISYRIFIHPRTLPTELLELGLLGNSVNNLYVNLVCDRKRRAIKRRAFCLLRWQLFTQTVVQSNERFSRKMCKPLFPALIQFSWINCFHNK